MTQIQTPYDPIQEEAPPVEIDEFEGFIDTYSFGGTQTYMLPDGKQWIAFKILNEGEKAQYQRLTNRDIKVNRKTDDASFTPDPAADRHALILTAVTDWNLFTKDAKTLKWTRLSFNQAMLNNWLKVTDPKLVEDLEKVIRKANPWLSAEEATEEELQAEINELTEQLNNVRTRNAGKRIVREQAKLLVADKEITGAHPHIRLYIDLAAMEWNHLPIAGGWWDQDPEFLDSVRIIRQEQVRHEREEKRREKVNRKSPGLRSGM